MRHGLRISVQAQFAIIPSLETTIGLPAGDMTDPTPTRRFRPTPAWLVLALLVVEGLLWLSERYEWFWFNEKKGWTVLIAVAVVGVALLVMLLWFIASLLFRWRFQFSIRSLLVLTVAVPAV